MDLSRLLTSSSRGVSRARGGGDPGEAGKEREDLHKRRGHMTTSEGRILRSSEVGNTYHQRYKLDDKSCHWFTSLTFLFYFLGHRTKEGVKTVPSMEEQEVFQRRGQAIPLQ